MRASPVLQRTILLTDGLLNQTHAKAQKSFYLNQDLGAVRKSLLLQIDVDKDPIASCT